MKRLALLLPLLLTLAAAAADAATDRPASRPTVVLLHGLARSRGSMEKMAAALDQAGFRTCNLSYPSTSYPVQELAELLLPAIAACRDGGTDEINFVTHSMGGIIVRFLAATHPELPIARVVMLSPPNRGSETVDKLGNFGLFKWFNGPAGQELGSGPESLPNRLGPAPFEAGIITGDRSINPLLSMLIPGEDDGKVAVSRAKLEGMRDFLVIHATHPLIMRNRRAIAQTINFLRRGSFEVEER
jgi:pimeloyl-ACP methyl ester carboxylesterase